jgi:hypothetical protein
MQIRKGKIKIYVKKVGIMEWLLCKVEIFKTMYRGSIRNTSFA